MDKFVVAFTGAENTPNQNLFPFSHKGVSKVTGDEVEIMTHRAPLFGINGDFSSISKNFDLWLNFTINSHKTNYTESEGIAIDLLGSSYREVPRLSKTAQLIKLQVIKAKTHLPTFLVPKVMMMSEFRAEFIPSFEKIVTKPEYGAKSGGQALVKKCDYGLFTEFSRNRSREQLEKMFKDVVMTKDHVEKRMYFNEQEFCVSEFIHDVHSEYRIIVIGDNIVGYPRKRIDGAYPRVESNFEEEAPEVQEYSSLVKLFGENNETLLRFIVKKLNFSYGSMDVFLTKNGDLGIFEWSPEFTSYRGDVGQIQKLHGDFLVSLYDEHKALL